MKAMKFLTQGEGVLHQLEPDIIEDVKEFQPSKNQNECGKSVNEKEILDRPIKITTVSGEILLESDDVCIFHCFNFSSNRSTWIRKETL